MLSTDELTDEQAEWWRRGRNREREWFRDRLGLDVELRAEGAVAVDPEGELTDVEFPGAGSARRLALLVLEGLADRLRAGAREAAAEERVWRRAGPELVAAVSSEVLATWGRGVQAGVPRRRRRGARRRPVRARRRRARPAPPGRGVARARRRGAVRGARLDHRRLAGRPAVAVRGGGTVTDRFRFSRAGVLNVWQYDDQVFEFADGRLLLRGANGAGKSKTLEMLLPFVLDGDKQRMTASARHHTSLLWLMLDGYGKQNRAGYLWVEFARPGEVVTCGVGIRASQSARTATSWYFTVPGRVGEELTLEDDAGPLARERLRTAVEAAGGHFFDSPRGYKQHVGRLLFGLAPTQYDELLRLLYWLRQPQVGEDIEPARLAEQLVQALPQLDDDAVRAAGDTFDELAAFGEQLDRQRRSAEGVAALATTYGHYAREVLRGRGAEAVEQHRERSRRARDAERCAADVAGLATERAAAEAEQGTVATQRRECEARLVELRGDPAWKDARELRARQEMARERATAAEAARKAADGARRRAETSGERVRRDAGGLETAVSAHVVRVGELATELAGAGARVALAVPAALHDVHLLAVDAAQAGGRGSGRPTPMPPAAPARSSAGCSPPSRSSTPPARRSTAPSRPGSAPSRTPPSPSSGPRRSAAAWRTRVARPPPPATSTRRRSGRGGTTRRPCPSTCPTS